MKKIKSILLFGTGFGIVCLTFGLILKFGGILSPILMIDQENGERYMPDKMCCSIFNYEGFGLARTNEDGWFGPAFHDNGENDVSLAVLGNSFIAARQVFYRHNFLSLSEAILQGERRNVHLFNFGKETMPLREALYIKEELEQKYHPDYFVVFINERSLGNEGRYIPFYELTGDSLTLNTDFQHKPFVKNYSKLEFLTSSSLVFLTYRAKNRIPEFKEIVLDKFYPSENEAEADAKIDREVDEVDAAVIRKFASDKRVIFLLDINEKRKEQIRSLVNGAPIIDVKTALKELENQGVDPYFWQVSNERGHWNHAAHRVIANTFVAQLKAILDKEKS
ncbi:MAG: hypothetical protein KDD54_03860 [Flavobacteriales bacterium]|nr:hypothetical protein [Flavobacteriales bacterium]